MAEPVATEPANRTPDVESPRQLNIFFRLTVVAASVFVVTILASLSTLFGDPLSPVNQFLEREANTMLVTEVVAILVLGLLALVVDRRQTLRQQAQLATANTTTADTSTADTSTADIAAAADSQTDNRSASPLQDAASD